ncbi:MAG: di-trans,poly-cis-decaprenylcistransferase [Puniceicoccales bacterium]|jgi:undecaprenyl diphosphate synthase|nr:di-trans,poly-cis-decaprenylcistransferase [Puniceicoccales bacterium]
MDSIGPIPLHVGLIMDGNGRWAERRGKPRLYGHRRGAENVRRIVTHAQSLGIRFLTLYAFSLENNRRPAAEVDGLLSLFELYTRRWLAQLLERGIRIRLIGDVEALRPSTARALRQLEEESRKGERMTVILAANYGGRDEVLRAIRRLWQSGATEGPIRWEDFEKFLDTAGIPDPDLILRSSGEMRLSHFLPLQSVYSELYFPSVLWPDFSERDLDEAVAIYRRRRRRFGRLEGRE